MALNGNQILYNTAAAAPSAAFPLRRTFLRPSWDWSSWKARNLVIVSASKKLSSRTGKFDSKKRRSSVSTKEEEEEDRAAVQEEDSQFKDSDRTAEVEGSAGSGSSGTVYDDGFVLPELPGDKPDFWEGPQWDAFGFFIQYLWAFGIFFALIACAIAVTTYNEGATDFKDTPVFKESIQSRELLEEPESSKADVFESNPTEAAPNLD